MNLEERQASINQDLAIAAAKKATVRALTDRELEALNMVAMGISWSSIAKKLEFATAGGAQKFAMRALEKRADQITEVGAARARALLLHRIDLMLGQWLPQALLGDDKAAKVVLDCLTRQEKLLGLAAPKQVEHHHEHEVQIKTPEQRRAAIVTSLEAFKSRTIDGEVTAA